MATRGAIARIKNIQPLEFGGRYVHWDCYPTGLGTSLWQAYHGHFKADLTQMLKYLLDEHPAGWSSLCGVDFSLAAGFRELGEQSRTGNVSEDAPHCYCHGDRSEPAQEITEQNASGCGCEWVYAFAHSLPVASTTPLKQNGHPNGSIWAMSTNVRRNGLTKANTLNTRIPSSDDGNPGAPLLRPTMLVLSSFTSHGDKMIGMFGFGDPNAHWRVVAAFDLHGQEPDWHRVEEQGHAKRRAQVLTNHPAAWTASPS